MCFFYLYSPDNYEVLLPLFQRRLNRFDFSHKQDIAKLFFQSHAYLEKRKSILFFADITMRNVYQEKHYFPPTFSHSIDIMSAMSVLFLVTLHHVTTHIKISLSV